MPERVGRVQPVHPMKRQIRCDAWTAVIFTDGTVSPARCQAPDLHVGRHQVEYREADGSPKSVRWDDTDNERRQQQ